MKKFSAAVLAAVLCAGPALAAGLEGDTARESYSFGASLGKYVSSQVYKQTEIGAETDMELVIRGFEDALKGKSELSDDDILKGLNSRAEKLNALKEAAMQKMRDENSAASAAFLAENAKKKGVVTTESGLQYEVLQEGTGAKPAPEDVVTVDYVGRLFNGTEFDSTYKSNEPARFALMSTIPGFREGLGLMGEGARYRLAIPAALAYGADGTGPIPPETALVFEVTLKKVEKVEAHGSVPMPGMGGDLPPGHPEVKK